ncbi:hypothetical protein, partial [Pseudomonas sp. 3A(2025)]
YFQKFSTHPNFDHLRAERSFDQLVSGRRIIQQPKLLSTAFFTAGPGGLHHSLAVFASNSLIFKEFSVSSAAGMVRIIER